QPSGPRFHAKANCISCHNQSLPAVAVKLASEAGVGVDTEVAKHSSKATLDMWSPSRENFLMGNCSIFGFLGNVSYGLLALPEAGARPTAPADAAVAGWSGLQRPDGGWEGGDMRPPLAGRSPIVYTALAVRALKTYSPGAMAESSAAQITHALEYLRS